MLTHTLVSVAPVAPTSPTAYELSAQLVELMLADLEGLENLGPEYLSLRIALMQQTRREFDASVSSRRDTVRPPGK